MINRLVRLDGLDRYGGYVRYGGLIVVIVWLSLMVKLLNSWIGEKDLILKPSLRLG
jgi:hypothetical protein